MSQKHLLYTIIYTVLIEMSSIGRSLVWSRLIVKKGPILMISVLCFISIVSIKMQKQLFNNNGL